MEHFQKLLNEAKQTSAGTATECTKTTKEGDYNMYDPMDVINTEKEVRTQIKKPRTIKLPSSTTYQARY